MNENTAFFTELFLVLAANGTGTRYICQHCDRVVTSDSAPTVMDIQTIKQMMRGFYCRHLVFDTVPWTICEECQCVVCPQCSFDIIHNSLQDGMLTSFCLKCNADYSYEDVINSVTMGEVIVFDVMYASDEEERDVLDMDQYEELVTTRENATDQDCPVCLEKRARIDRLDCGHSFCRDCLFRSLSIQRKCPMCRAEVGL